jgi:hypothetical protein
VQLTELDLAYTKLTDRGLKELVGLKRLTFLNLLETATTEAEVTRFKVAVPDCIVSRRSD